MTHLSTFLWYDTEAEEAATFYTSLFDDGEITGVRHFGSAGPRPAGMVSEVEFTMAGHTLIALNGGPGMEFTQAVSLMIHCDGQDEVDRLWERLIDGGKPGPCGWLEDRFGVSWQIIPTLLVELLGDADEVKAQAVMAAMLQMGKIDCAALRAAHDAA